MGAVLPTLGASAHGPHTSANVEHISLAFSLVLANELRLAPLEDGVVA